MTTIENTSIPPYKETFSLRKFVRANGTQLGIFSVFLALVCHFHPFRAGYFPETADLLRFHVDDPILRHHGDAFDDPGHRRGNGSLLPFDHGDGNGGLFINLFSIPIDLVEFCGCVADRALRRLAERLHRCAVRHPLPGRHDRHAVLLARRSPGAFAEQERLSGLRHGHPIAQILVGKLFGVIPMQMVWLIVIAVLSWVLLNRTRFGAHIYLIGDNAESAKLMGVNCGKVRIRAFMLVGFGRCFAGVVASLHVKFFWPSLGDGYLLRTLASVFLGGTSVFGGVGTIFGTFIGAFIIGSIEAATVAVGLTGFWTQLIYGLIILISVTMHSYLRRRME